MRGGILSGLAGFYTGAGLNIRVDMGISARPRRGLPGYLKVKTDGCSFTVTQCGMRNRLDTGLVESRGILA